MARSVELDADALIIRATVLTYRWIDDLQVAAYRTLGSIAARAVGYLAPEVALGGAIISAGLIETEALDREGLAAYLNELADANPELMDHFVSGGGGLLDALQMRALLTAAVLGGSDGAAATRGGLRAVGAPEFEADFSAGLRDVAAGFVTPEPEAPRAGSADLGAPRSIEELMTSLSQVEGELLVQRLGGGRFIGYLPNPATRSDTLRLVGGDNHGRVASVVAALESAIGDEPNARVLLVGHAQGGVTAAEIASGAAFVDVHHRPGHHRRRPVGAGAADPGPHHGALARGPRGPGGTARLADQRGRRQPADRGLRRRRGARRRGVRRGRTGRRRGRPPGPAGRRSSGSRSSATSPADARHTMSWTNSPSWVRLRHSTMSTTSA